MSASRFRVVGSSGRSHLLPRYCRRNIARVQRCEDRQKSGKNPPFELAPLGSWPKPAGRALPQTVDVRFGPCGGRRKVNVPYNSSVIGCSSLLMLLVSEGLRIGQVQEHTARNCSKPGAVSIRD